MRTALANWEPLLHDTSDLHWLENALRSAGLHAEAFALQAAMARRRPDDSRSWVQLIRSVLDSGDPWWARQLLEESTGQSRALSALRIETASEDADAERLIAAWLREHDDESAGAAAIEWYVRRGQLDEAERLLRDTPALRVWRARFALWRDDAEAALTLLQTCEDCAEVRCLVAIAHVRQGRLDEAESALRALLDSDQRAHAYAWLATVLRKQGRYAEAANAADIATLAESRFNLVSRIEYALADASARASGSNPSGVVSRVRRAVELRLRSIDALEHATALYSLGLKRGDSLTTLAPLIERFAGNHTSSVTTFDAGSLVAHRVPIDPRYFGASIQRVLWTRGADAARALYAEHASRVDRHPLFLIYQGELELWLGAYEDAAKIFREAIRRYRRVRWGWIGLGASAMFQGDLREAQRIWKRGRSFTDWRTGFAGPTLYAYRGECYRRQGLIERAGRDLSMAIRHKPQRISARINLALLSGNADDIAAVERDCRAVAPFLMDELSGSTTEQLEGVLAAMRGNRSSSPWQVTYHLWGRVWRRAG